MNRLFILAAISLFLLDCRARADDPPQPATAAETQTRIKERDRLIAESERCHRDGKLPEAIAAADKALALQRAITGPNHIAVANRIERLVDLQVEGDDIAAAGQMNREDQDVLTQLYGKDGWQVKVSIVKAVHIQQVAALSPEQRHKLVEAKRLDVKLRELYGSRQYREALPLGMEVLDAYQQLLGEDSNYVALACNMLGLVYKAQGDFVRAESFQRRSAEKNKAIYGERHPFFATDLQNLSSLYVAWGEYERAEPMSRQALAIREETLGPKSAQAIGDRKDLADIYGRIAGRASDAGNFASARTNWTKKLDLTTRVYGANSWRAIDDRLALADVDRLASLSVEQRRGLAGAERQQREAEKLKLDGKTEEAIDACGQALAVRKELLGEQHRLVAETVNLRGSLAFTTGDFEQAEKLWQQAMGIRKSILGEDHPDYALSLNNLGTLYLDRHELARAEPLLRGAFERSKKALGPKNASAQNQLKNLINACQQIANEKSTNEDFAGAIKMRRDLVALQIELNTVSHWQVAEARVDLAFAERMANLTKDQRERVAEARRQFLAMEQLSTKGKYRDALVPCQQALETRRELLGENSREYANMLSWLGHIHIWLKDDVGAEPPYRQAVEISHRTLGDAHPTTVGFLKTVADLYQRLASACEDKGDLAGAQAAYENLVTMRGRQFGLNHWRTTDARQLLEIVKRKAQLTPEQRQRLQVGNDAHAKMIALSRQHKYREAIQPCRTALAIRKELLGPDSTWTLSTLSSLGYIYFKANEIERAGPVIAESVEATQRILGEAHPTYVLHLYTQINYYQFIGDDGRAESTFRRALRIMQDLGTESDAGNESSFNEIVAMYERRANNCQEDGDWAAAARAWDKVVGLYTYRYGATNWKVRNAQLDRDYATTVGRFTSEQRRRLFEANDLASQEHTLYGQRKYAEALALAQKVIAIDRDLFGEGSFLYAVWLSNLGGLYDALGDGAKAETYYLQALSRRKELYGENHPIFATTLESLGDYYRARYQYTRAEPFYQQSLSIRKRALGEDHADVARSSNRLALVYQELGRYDKAESLLQRAVEIAKKTPGEDYSAFLQNLASVYQALGDYDRAESLYQTAIAVCRTTKDVGKTELAFSLTNLASLYQTTHELAKAEPMLLEALELRKKELGADHTQTATTSLALAELYLARNDIARAEPYLKHALDVRKKKFGENHPAYAAALSDQAWLHLLRGEFDEAEPLYRQHLEVMRATNGETSPDYLNALSNIAWLYDNRGDFARAATYYRQYLDGSRHNWELAAAGRSERQQLRMAQTLRVGLDAYLADAPRAGLIAEEEYPYVLAWKGVVFDRQRWARDQRRVLRERKGDVAKLYTDLETTTARLAGLALAGPEKRQQDGFQRDLRDLTLRKEQIENDLARRGSLFRKKGESGPTVGQLRASLPAGTALIDFLEFTASIPPSGEKKTWEHPRHLLAFVIRPGKAVERVDLGPAEPVATAVEIWRETIGSGKPARGADPAVELQRLVWQPLQDFLVGVKTVLVSPDGALARFPFAALPGKAPGSYLIEDLAVAVVPVPRMLPEMLGTASTRGQGQSLLLLGDVDFGSAPVAAAPVGGDGSVSRYPGAAVNSARLLPVMPPLEGTRAEVAAVGEVFGRRFPTGQVRTLSKEQATKAALRQQAPSAQWLHLATHGFFAPPAVRSALAPSAGKTDGSADMFARGGVAGFHPGLLSGLVLAGANRPAESNQDEGVLTALEVESLDLGVAELVVLSACETGLGETAGGEGLLGLQRAFQVAGARSVVAGLWKVDDNATQALMAAFYRQLWDEKKSKLEALREAQLTLLREYDPVAGKLRGVGGVATDVAPKAPGAKLPPFYWAAFSLSGDWR